MRELEICCDNWVSALTAQKGGAHRIELCSAITEGGLTPSFGLIKQAIKKISIPIHILIRPRSGDFLYSDDEIEIMKTDVAFCKKQGAAGVVLGFLTSEGDIDVKLTKKFVDLARPMKVTFHRAFDMCKDPFIALDELKEIGVDYILTSGQASTAEKGSELIKELVDKQGRHLKIMPGSGVRDHNIAELLAYTKASSFHLSARIMDESKMTYRKSSVAMGHETIDKEYQIINHDEDSIRLARNILSSR